MEVKTEFGSLKHWEKGGVSAISAATGGRR